MRKRPILFGDSLHKTKIEKNERFGIIKVDLHFLHIELRTVAERSLISGHD